MVEYSYKCGPSNDHVTLPPSFSTSQGETPHLTIRPTEKEKETFTRFTRLPVLFVSVPFGLLVFAR